MLSGGVTSTSLFRVVSLGERNTVLICWADDVFKKAVKKQNAVGVIHLKIVVRVFIVSQSFENESSNNCCILFSKDC